MIFGCVLLRVFGDFTAPPGHVMESLVPETLLHLEDSHLEYFTSWSKMLLVESSTEAKWKIVRDIWCKTVSERYESASLRLE